MKASLSSQHLLVMLLAVFLTVGFSLSAARASIMSTMMKVDGAMTMQANAGMGKIADTAMGGDCKACLKDVGGNGGPIHCPPTCIAPVLGVLPQGLPVMVTSRIEQPLALPTPFLRGRSFLPDPFPPRPSA